MKALKWLTGAGTGVFGTRVEVSGYAMGVGVGGLGGGGGGDGFGGDRVVDVALDTRAAGARPARPRPLPRPPRPPPLVIWVIERDGCGAS